jgi:hypothetical protein
LEKYKQNYIIFVDLFRAASSTDPSTALSIVTAGSWRPYEALQATWVDDMDKVYRVVFHPKIEVMYLGMGKGDDTVVGEYATAEELPAWLQRKIAVLAMTEVNPPQTKIEGIGMRIDTITYWVISDE